MNDLKVAIIGAGNMGGAIARALAKGDCVCMEHIRVSNPSRGKLDALQAEFPGMVTTSSNKEVVRGADIVVLAVKPWLVAQVLDEVGALVESGAIVISVAAGISLDELAGLLYRTDVTLFRVIPNTAIEVGQGVSTISAQHATAAQQELVTRLFNEMGKAFFVPEAQLNAYTSLSSCGIAYAFRYIRASMEGGVEMGIYPQVAKEVVMQTLRGAVALLEANGSHPEAEVDKVTTPGGITIRGLNEMEANGFTNAVIKGLKASKI